MPEPNACNTLDKMNTSHMKCHAVLINHSSSKVSNPSHTDQRSNQPTPRSKYPSIPIFQIKPITLKCVHQEIDIGYPNLKPSIAAMHVTGWTTGYVYHLTVKAKHSTIYICKLSQHSIFNMLSVSQALNNASDY